MEAGVHARKNLFTKIDRQPAAHNLPNPVLSYKFPECKSYFLVFYVYLAELLAFVFYTMIDKCIFNKTDKYSHVLPTFFLHILASKLLRTRCIKNAKPTSLFYLVR